MRFSPRIRSCRSFCGSPPRRFRATLEELESRLAPSVSVLSYHNDAASTGQDLAESALTPANVNAATFGKQFSTLVDGQVFAQPLYVPGVTITVGASLGIHNIVLVATERDSLYALDATTGSVLWQKAFANPAANVTPVPSGDVNNGAITPMIGITGTPVVDPIAGIVYLDAYTKEVTGTSNHYIHRLHALSLSDGSEKLGGPVVIADTIFDGTNYVLAAGPSVNGTGSGSVGGRITFNAVRQLQRPGLTLANGNVYLAYGSHDDNGPYHGWILGYNAQTLMPTAAFNDTPNGGLGGIWQSGGKILVDPAGNLYLQTGNGTFDAPAITQGFPANGDYGDSVLKLAVDPNSTSTNPNVNGWGLKVVDYFTPFNQAGLNNGDLDLGSGALMLLPDSVGSAAHPHLLVGTGKEGRIYLLDRDNLGRFDPNTDHVIQEVVKAFNGSFDTPAYFNNAIYYVGGYNGGGTVPPNLGLTFSINNGLLSTSPTSQSLDSYGFPGSTPSISANGSANGIVWDLDRSTSQLRAYDASSYATELYTSAQAAAGRDSLGSVVKFTVPTVAAGMVYVGTTDHVVAYGLLTLAPMPPAAPSNLVAMAISAHQINLTWTDNASTENGFQIEQSIDGITFTQVGIASVNATAFAVGGLQASTVYTFRVRAFNNVGASGYTNTSTAATTASTGTGGLDFANGFAAANPLLTFNGPSAVISGSKLQLTDAGMREAASVFSTSRVETSQFTSQFSFQILDGSTPSADGFTFTIQGVSPTALGSSGGNLGYGPAIPLVPGIGHSIAVKFDLYSNLGEGTNSTGLYTNGAEPTLAGSIDLLPTGVDLHSGHVFNVSLTYANSTLQVTITDTTTTASAQQTYASLNIPSLLGSNLGFVGFTGSTGGLTAFQDILSWSFTPTPPPPAAPTNLAATATSGTQVQLTWTDNATNETGFQIERSTGGTTFAQVATVGMGVTSYLDPGLNTGAQYFYRIRAANAGGTSGYSNVAPVTTPVPPSTPSNARAILITTTEIDLDWTDNSNNEDGFKIFRKNGLAGTFGLVTTLPTNSASYKDMGLVPGSAYDYHIQAFNIAGFSGLADLSTVTLPLAPSNLLATAGPGQVALSWTASAGATTYNVYRGTTVGGEGTTPFMTGLSGTSIKDTAVIRGTTYFYQVSAVDPGGESTRSSEVSAALTGLFSAHINFSNNQTQIPTGYVNDIGLAYGNRGNGLTFGWNVDNRSNARDRNSSRSPDEVHDSFIQMHALRSADPNASWRIAVPNGVYKVHVIAGDPNSFGAVYGIEVQGVLAITGRTSSSSRWLENTITVTVTNGTLVIRNQPGSGINKIDGVDIMQTSAAAASGLASAPLIGWLPPEPAVTLAGFQVLPIAAPLDDTVPSGTGVAAASTVPGQQTAQNSTTKRPRSGLLAAVSHAPDPLRHASSPWIVQNEIEDEA